MLEARAFGYTTHNVAEYRGMIAGLLRAAEIGVTDLKVWGDSRVVIYQMTGASRARAEHLAALRDDARRAALKMSVEYVWNPRTENPEADALVNSHPIRVIGVTQMTPRVQGFIPRPQHSHCDKLRRCEASCMILSRRIWSFRVGWGNNRLSQVWDRWRSPTDRWTSSWQRRRARTDSRSE